MVIEDMIEQNLDPLNNNDIIEFWKDKGVDIDDADLYFS